MAKLQGGSTVYGALNVNGDINGLGNIYISTGVGTAITWQATSDVNMKKNITVIENPLDIIREWNGVDWEWIHNGEKSSGLIAQDVEKNKPELVVVDKDGIRHLNYDGTIGVLVECIKKLEAEIEELKSKTDK
jgi:hypothetical protein